MKVVPRFWRGNATSIPSYGKTHMNQYSCGAILLRDCHVTNPTSYLIITSGNPCDSRIIGPLGFMSAAWVGCGCRQRWSVRDVSHPTSAGSRSEPVHVARRKRTGSSSVRGKNETPSFPIYPCSRAAAGQPRRRLLSDGGNNLHAFSLGANQRRPHFRQCHRCHRIRSGGRQGDDHQRGDRQCSLRCSPIPPASMRSPTFRSATTPPRSACRVSRKQEQKDLNVVADGHVTADFKLKVGDLDAIRRSGLRRVRTDQHGLRRNVQDHRPEGSLEPGPERRQLYRAADPGARHRGHQSRSVQRHHEPHRHQPEHQRQPQRHAESHRGRRLQPGGRQQRQPDEQRELNVHSGSQSPDIQLLAPNMAATPAWHSMS